MDVVGNILGKKVGKHGKVIGYKKGKYIVKHWDSSICEVENLDDYPDKYEY